ncbi:unnamed protein product [Amoebophrya sp. A25]|nr:unnamed protein product [Amoebophrya sp. A25]|eukprot:GSA25T00003001001.1
MAPKKSAKRTPSRKSTPVRKGRSTPARKATPTKKGKSPSTSRTTSSRARTTSAKENKPSTNTTTRGSCTSSTSTTGPSRIKGTSSTATRVAASTTKSSPSKNLKANAMSMKSSCSSTTSNNKKRSRSVSPNVGRGGKGATTSSKSGLSNATTTSTAAATAAASKLSRSTSTAAASKSRSTSAMRSSPAPKMQKKSSSTPSASKAKKVAPRTSSTSRGRARVGETAVAGPSSISPSRNRTPTTRKKKMLISPSSPSPASAKKTKTSAMRVSTSSRTPKKDKKPLSGVKNTRLSSPSKPMGSMKISPTRAKEAEAFAAGKQKTSKSSSKSSGRLGLNSRGGSEGSSPSTATHLMPLEGAPPLGLGVVDADIKVEKAPLESDDVENEIQGHQRFLDMLDEETTPASKRARFLLSPFDAKMQSPASSSGLAGIDAEVFEKDEDDHGRQEPKAMSETLKGKQPQSSAKKSPRRTKGILRGEKKNPAPPSDVLESSRSPFGKGNAPPAPLGSRSSTTSAQQQQREKVAFCQDVEEFEYEDAYDTGTAAGRRPHFQTPVEHQQSQLDFLFSNPEEWEKQPLYLENQRKRRQRFFLMTGYGCGGYGPAWIDEDEEEDNGEDDDADSGDDEEDFDHFDNAIRKGMNKQDQQSQQHVREGPPSSSSSSNGDGGRQTKKTNRFGPSTPAIRKSKSKSITGALSSSYLEGRDEDYSEQDGENDAAVVEGDAEKGDFYPDYIRTPPRGPLDDDSSEEDSHAAQPGSVDRHRENSLTPNSKKIVSDPGIMEPQHSLSMLEQQSPDGGSATAEQDLRGKLRQSETVGRLGKLQSSAASSSAASKTCSTTNASAEATTSTTSTTTTSITSLSTRKAPLEDAAATQRLQYQQLIESDDEQKYSQFLEPADEAKYSQFLEPADEEKYSQFLELAEPEVKGQKQDKHKVVHQSRNSNASSCSSPPPKNAKVVDKKLATPPQVPPSPFAQRQQRLIDENFEQQEVLMLRRNSKQTRSSMSPPARGLKTDAPPRTNIMIRDNSQEKHNDFNEARSHNDEHSHSFNEGGRGGNSDSDSILQVPIEPIQDLDEEEQEYLYKRIQEVTEGEG